MQIQKKALKSHDWSFEVWSEIKKSLASFHLHSSKLEFFNFLVRSSSLWFRNLLRLRYCLYVTLPREPNLCVGNVQKEKPQATSNWRCWVFKKKRLRDNLLSLKLTSLVWGIIARSFFNSLFLCTSTTRQPHVTILCLLDALVLVVRVIMPMITYCAGPTCEVWRRISY